MNVFGFGSSDAKRKPPVNNDQRVSKKINQNGVNKTNIESSNNSLENSILRRLILGDSHDGYTTGDSGYNSSGTDDLDESSISSNDSIETVENLKRSDSITELIGKLRWFKDKFIEIKKFSIPDILKLGSYNTLDSPVLMNEVCKQETLDSESAQQKAIFATADGTPLSDSESNVLKEKIKCVPSNHLLIRSESSLATRSGRVDTSERVKQVLEDGAAAIYDNIDPILRPAFDNVTDENRQEKNQLLKGTGFVWKKSKGEIKLHHKMNLTTGMDSLKSPEGTYFENMKAYCSTYSSKEMLLNNKINSADTTTGSVNPSTNDFKCIIEQPLFTVSPQSAFGHQLSAEGVVAWAFGGQKKNNIMAHKNQLPLRIEFLKQACEDYGVGNEKNHLSKEFKDLLDTGLSKNVINAALNNEDSHLKPQEKLFLKYVNFIKYEINPKELPMPINSKLIFEVGIDAFDSLSGISSHKSCKSGQDRTLTQIAFQAVLANNNYTIPETPDDKALFAAQFFENAAMQATSVIEFARGEGGKIKWEIDSSLSEQPIPGKMNGWVKNNEEKAIQYLADSCINTDGELDREKFNHLVKGLKSLTLVNFSKKLNSAVVG